MAKEKTSESSAKDVSFEQALAKLEEIVHDLEEGEVGLADAIQRYEEGIKLLKQCHGLLECAERKIELLSGVDASGNAVVQPFDDESSVALQEKGQSRSRRRSAEDSDSTTGRKREAGTSGIDVPGGLF